MNVFRMDDLVVDLDRRIALRNGAQIPLTELNFRMLACLIGHAPQPVSISQLAQEVWGTPHVTTETVAQRTRLLRKALGDDGQAPRYVRTHRGHGYSMVGSRVAVATPTSWAGWRRWAAATAALLLALGLVFGQFPLDEESTSPPPAMPAALPDQLVKRAKENLRLHQRRPTEQAIELLREARSINPDHFPARLTLSFALSTHGTKFAEDPIASILEAETLARGALREDINNSNAWSALGYALDAQGRVTEALAGYERAIALDATNLPALSSAAYLYGVQGSLFRALEMDATGIVHANYSRYADIQIARSLDLLGYPAAQDWFERAQRLAPGQSVIVSEVARAKLRQGDPAGALVALDQSVDLDNPKLLELRGRAQLALGDVAAAEMSFKRAGQRGKFALAALSAKYHRRISQTLLDEIDNALASDDAWPELRIGVAELHAAGGQFDASLPLVRQAIDLGWRDMALIERSPFLSPLRETDEWQGLRQRVARELAMQRQLIESHARTRMLLSPKALQEGTQI